MVDTERTILDAAKAVFLRKGLAATSMQDIADATGMSRTLLNYYYRKKETLFRAILINTVNEIIPKIHTIIETDLPLIAKVERVIDIYLDLLLEDPMYPHFLLMEIQRDPGALIGLIRSHSNNFGSLARIEQQIKDEALIPIPETNALPHLFVSIYGLLLFPFLVRPALDEVFFDKDPEAFPRFMREQKKITMAMLQGLIKSSPAPLQKKKTAKNPASSQNTQVINASPPVSRPKSRRASPPPLEY